MKFARIVFTTAGIYGLLLIVPMYVFEGTIGSAFPPAITHPEYYYGFIGVVIAWQIAFLVIARDPVRYRPIMLAAIAEKVLYAGAVIALFAADRVPVIILAGGIADGILGTLFLASFLRLRNE